MKTNMPVTNQEILMDQHALLISKTDLKGIITYANDEFIKVSGFTRDELINAKHNIVRHPDMPPGDFKDLWITLNSLRYWQGVLKNRTKSGDHYWVEANVTPVFKNGKVYEYLSIQRTPSREKIKKEELLHRLRNANKAITRTTGLAAMVESSKKMALALLLAPVFYLMYRLFLAQDYSLLTGVTVSVALASAISFNLFKNLNKSINTFYCLIEKKFGNRPDLARNDLFGDCQHALYVMAVDFNLTRTKDHVSRALQVSQAMDDMHAGVMIINNNSEIIYMNNSLLETLKKAANDRGHRCRVSTPINPIGVNTDNSHSNPAHQCHLPARLEDCSELHIAGHVIRFTVRS
jgi:methyl-accepting chemotaxis protein